MKKSVLFLGVVVSFLSLTSCTTDDLDQNFNNSNIQLDEEMNQNFYQRDSDSIVPQPTNNASGTNDGDPILKPKNG